MADNYLERQRDEYEKRKAAGMHSKKRGARKTDTPKEKRTAPETAS
ncbi:hypothetical protein HMPREF9012_0884 [Bacteroidetes bacterium oral taxon 272 str. F0290]|nr:hypothetical protein HMPREF9012_0884 [Bacteroidetes bacterium oral taxon 272 str. F0290]